MSFQHLQHSTACQSHTGFLSPFLGSPPSSFPGCESSEMGFQFLSSPLEQQQNGWGDSGEDQDSVEMEPRGENSAAGRPHKICSRGHWRPVEDAKLKELVSEYGPQNWNLIAEKLQGRSGKSCRLRWFNQLDPRINRRAFSEEEEERLLAAHGMYGNKWAMIARLFPGRTDNAVKNHWHVIRARRQREQSSIYKRRKLACAQPLYKTAEITNYPDNPEATTTNTRDESVSTCTDLSLSSSSTRGHPWLITSNNSQLYQHPHIFQMGSGNGFYHIGSREMIMGVNQSDNSSNSEASATDSLAIHKWNLNTNGDTENRSREVNVPFIDFLGVGAT